jgi:hypothetical protein
MRLAIAFLFVPCLPASLAAQVICFLMGLNHPPQSRLWSLRAEVSNIRVTHPGARTRFGGCDPCAFAGCISGPKWCPIVRGKSGRR